MFEEMTFKEYRRFAINCARDFHYERVMRDVFERLRNAKTDGEIEHIMCTCRHAVKR